MLLKLFLVAAQAGGDNFDWFVAAETPEQATELWRKIEMVEDFGLTEPDSVWQVPDIGPLTGPKVFEWPESGVIS